MCVAVLQLASWPPYSSKREVVSVSMSSGRSRKRRLDGVPEQSANLVPLGSKSASVGLLPTPSTHSGEPRRHSDVSIAPSRYSEAERRHSDASERSSKMARFGDDELAGKEAELQFPEV